MGYTAYAGPEKKPSRVVIRDDLTGEDYDAVLGHEVGHVIDQYVGEIPVPKDTRSELDGLFNTLNNPRRDDINPDYADLIRQTRERSPTQADELFRTTFDGLGSEHAIRLRDALDDPADAPYRAHRISRTIQVSVGYHLSEHRF